MQSNDQVINAVKTIIGSKLYLKKEEDGTYVGNIYVSYNDELPPDTIRKIVDSTNPRDAFYDALDTAEAEGYEYHELLEMIERNWNEKENGSYSEHRDLIAEWVYENVMFNFPYDHFLQQEVLVNIIVNTGDGNYDFTLNNFCCYDAESREIINEKSSILWLVRQQGYGKRQLNKAVRKQDYSGSKFLESVYRECLNVTTHMNALTFFVKMTLGQMLDYMEHPTDITLSEESSCGLFDAWNGAGSLLEIELEKPVVIPKRFVEMGVDGSRGYSMANTYGMMETFWKDTLLTRITVAA